MSIHIIPARPVAGFKLMKAFVASPFVIVAPVLALFGGIGPGQSTALAVTVDRTLGDYVLFAFDTLTWKGGNTSGGNILGGNVGANSVDLNAPGNPTATGDVGANALFHMSDNTQLVADTLRFGSSASVWDVFANNLVNSSPPGTIRDASNPNLMPFAHASDVPNPPSAILPLADIPTLPFTPDGSVTDGATDLDVNKNDTLTLPPVPATETYRDVTVENGATLILGAGTYHFRNFQAGKNANIIVTDSTIIDVDGEFMLNDNTDFGLGTLGLAEVNVGSLGAGVHDKSVEFGANDDIGGQFFVPNGQLNFGRASDATGRFWADDISSDFNVDVTYSAPQTPINVPPPPVDGVPEPLTAVTGLLAAGALALGASRRRR